jgi:hypothetical protein
MIDTIMTDESAKGLFGISINAVGKTRPANMGGEVVNYVEEFQRVDSADVVTEPAARGKFDKMLESKRGSSNRATKSVSKSVMSSHLKESGVPPKKAKEVADSLVAAYNSDNPDEVKQAAYEASKVLYGFSSISGKGPGQTNEEQYSNINPSGGGDSMKSPRLKTSRGSKEAGAKLRFRKKKVLKAAAGTGPDNENLPEPSPEDTRLATESDVEDDEGEDLGSFDDFGDSSKKVKASATKEAEEDEAEEDEAEEDETEEADEGLEDDGDGSQAPVMDDGDGDGDDGDGADAMGAGGEGVDDDLGEALEDEGEEDEGEEGLEDEGEEDEGGEMGSIPSTMGGKGPIAESRARRMKSKEACNFGKSGKATLPSHAIGEYDEDFKTPNKDSSTGASGKSYKLKTSKFRKNRLARRVAHEANRRIGKLADGITRLRESLKAARRQNERLSGILAYNNSKRSAFKLLREAVRNELLDVGMARVMQRKLYGLNRDDQIIEIETTARLLESARRSTVATLRESVEGNGGRGTGAFRMESGGGNSGLVEGFAADGIPMKD